MYVTPRSAQCQLRLTTLELNEYLIGFKMPILKVIISLGLSYKFNQLPWRRFAFAGQCNIIQSTILSQTEDLPCTKYRIPPNCSTPL